MAVVGSKGGCTSPKGMLAHPRGHMWRVSPAGWWGVRLNHQHCLDLTPLRQHHQHRESPAEAACGFIRPAQFTGLTYLAQQGLDHSVPELLQVKIRSEIQANGSSCSPKTDRHDIVTEPRQRAAAADSSDCHKRHWGPCSSSLEHLGSEEAAPQPYSGCSKKPLPPTLDFLSTGFQERLLFSTVFRREAFPGELCPAGPFRKLCVHPVWGLQGCNSAVLAWLGGKVGMRCPPALPVPLHRGHQVR